jgi:glycerophosphoryl diester phosphodiesterase
MIRKAARFGQGLCQGRARQRYIISVYGQIGPDGNVLDINRDGKIDDADMRTMAPTGLVAAAHRAGLFVHPYTFRNERRRLATTTAAIRQPNTGTTIVSGWTAYFPTSPIRLLSPEATN